MNQDCFLSKTMLKPEVKLETEEDHYTDYVFDQKRSTSPSTAVGLKLEASSNDSKGDRKACLKFCRKISRRVLEIIDQPHFSNILFELLDQITENYLHIVGAKSFNRVRFSAKSRSIIKGVWNLFKEQLASSKNKKICLVTQDEWNKMFSFSSFASQVREQTQDYQDVLQYIEFQNHRDKEIFVRVYARYQFVVNIIFVNTSIIADMCLTNQKNKKYSYNLDDCLLMVNFPSFYGNYNHTKGKFAIECCNRCKICRSTLLPSNFLEKLEDTRYKIKELKALYSALCLNMSNSTITLFSPEKCFILYTFSLNQIP